jgi:hypothetical protein
MESRKIIQLIRRAKTKTSKMNPGQKFEHFSNIRVYRLLRLMKSVGNLANKRYYQYTEKQKAKILKAVGQEYRKMKESWIRAGEKRFVNKKKGLWDQVNENK